MHKVRAKEVFKYGIATEEASVLFVVQAAGRKATPAEISRWTLRESHSISGLLMRMEKKGLVRKIRDLDKRNQVRVTLTRKGQEAYYKSAERVIIHRVLSYLSEEEQQQMRLVLEKLRDAAFKEGGIDKRPPFPIFD